jgi:glc operon protein GlcG
LIKKAEPMGISIDIAQKLVARAIDAGKAQELPIVVVVVDTAGDVVASARMDGVNAINFDVAQRKALTAAAFRMPTHDLVDMVSRDDLAKTTIMTDQRLCILPGGAPVMSGETVVGGVGIAGGYYLQDRAIVEYAVSE